MPTPRANASAGGGNGAVPSSSSAVTSAIAAALFQQALLLEIARSARMELESRVLRRVLGRRRVGGLERGNHLVVAIAERLRDLVRGVFREVVARGDVDPLGERGNVARGFLE